MYLVNTLSHFSLMTTFLYLTTLVQVRSAYLFLSRSTVQVSFFFNSATLNFILLWATLILYSSKPYVCSISAI